MSLGVAIGDLVSKIDYSGRCRVAPGVACSPRRVRIGPVVGLLCCVSDLVCGLGSEVRDGSALVRESSQG